MGIWSGFNTGERQPRVLEEPPLTFLSPEELKDLPEPSWLIDNILPEGTFAVLYGEPGCGKTFLALDWAASVAAQQEWGDRSVTGGAAFYVYAEGILGLPSRIRAWEERRGALQG